MSPQPKALLTDLDGVIRLWHNQGDAAIECEFDLPEGSIKQTAFESELLYRAITGQITDDAWRGEIALRLSQSFPNADAAEVVRRWSEPPGEVNWPTLELIRIVRRTVPVVLVTNATNRLPLDLTALGILDEFDAIINSSEVGHAKPEPDIFRAALSTVGVNPNETVFLDDSATNVEAATALGIPSYLVNHDTTALAEILAKTRLIPAPTRRNVE